MTRLLFVEDEPRGVDAYFPGLERDDFKCELALDLDDAIQKLQNNRYDILSLDIMFSNKKGNYGKLASHSAGLQLLKAIRRGEIKNCDRNLRVVVLTALSSKQIERKIRELGVTAYLTKPTDYNTVMRILKGLKKS